MTEQRVSAVDAGGDGSQQDGLERPEMFGREKRERGERSPRSVLKRQKDETKRPSRRRTPSRPRRRPGLVIHSSCEL